MVEYSGESKMNGIKEARGSTLAERNTVLKTSYRKVDNQSSLKEEIGYFLLQLVAGQTQPESWQYFDRLVQQLYEGGVR
jgi:hypothetical protein